MEILFLLAAIVSVVAGLLYLLEKFGKGNWVTRFVLHNKAPTVPIDTSSLFAYTNSHHRPTGIARKIAEKRGLSYQEVDSDFRSLMEQVEYFNLETIRDLDHLVKKHSKKAQHLSEYMNLGNYIDAGSVISFVLAIAAIEKGGLAELRKFYASLTLTSTDRGWAEEFFHDYEQIRKHR